MTTTQECISLDNQLNAELFQLNQLYSQLNEKQFYLVTMTLLYKTSFKCPDLSGLQKKFSVAAALCNSYIANFRQFKNSIIIKFQDNNMSIKIFTNGSIHVTGVKSYTSAFETVELVCSILNFVFTSDSDIKILSHCVQMINICCRTKYRYNMNKLFDMLSKEKNESIVTYNKEQHAAIKIKQNIKGPSIMVFKTGSIIISGCKTHSDFTLSGQSFYDHINRINFQSALLADL